MITSEKNNKIKDIIKYKKIKNIKKNKKYFVEGTHLVEEAIKNNVVLEVFVTEDYFDSRNLLLNNIHIEYISNNISKLISETISEQGIYAVCKIKEKDFNINSYKKVLILDKIQDPGNLGTLVRTAESFGFDCVILGEGTTNLYSQKTLRSMQGSNFYIDCFENVNLLNLLTEMKEYDVFVTTLKTKKYISNITEIKNKFAVILGNEGNGVSEELLILVNNPCKIKMVGNAESLNVAISGGIIMHHIMQLYEKGCEVYDKNNSIK